MECYKKVDYQVQSFITPKPLKSFKSFDNRITFGKIYDNNVFFPEGKQSKK